MDVLHLVVLVEIENVAVKEGGGVHLNPGHVRSWTEVRLEVGLAVTVPGVDQLEGGHRHQHRQ